MLAAHSFAAKAAHHVGESTVVAVDGEWALYREAETALSDSSMTDRPRRAERFHSEYESVGNVALVRLLENSIEITADDSGAFPLYYCHERGGFLFSSLLRPLAQAVGSVRDDLAILEFLREGYTVGSRTALRGIHRLLPGQRVTYSMGARAVLGERSRAWISDPQEEPIPDASQVAWQKLLAAVEGSVPRSNATLMMSGGWDSRTIMAAVSATGAAMDCYAHGDLSSRELQLVKDLCAVGGYECRLEQIDDRCLDTAMLQSGFSKTETVVFPHWHRAGRLLSANGTSAVVAGIYGEVLGGHYGPAMLTEGFHKILAVAKSMVGIESRLESAATARQFLGVGRLESHWYLRPGFVEDQDDPLERLNEDIENSISRLEHRGVVNQLSLVEAFVTEHRAAQYVSAQLLSCRSAVDVSIPFANRNFFRFASRVPLRAKIHNALNREMLLHHARSLLQMPMASTLVSASSPLVMQEASRAVRKMLDTGSSRLRSVAGLKPFSRSWVNFAFLHNGSALSTIVDDLRLDIWDRDSMLGTIKAHIGARHSLHPLYDQLCKIYTVDLLLRCP